MSLRTSVPNHLVHLLSNPDTDAQIVHLSRHASHASRVHAVVEIISSDAQPLVRILVIGQNGLRVISSGQARRLVPGQRLDLTPNSHEIELDFYGSRVRLDVRALYSDMNDRERLFTPPSDELRSPESSMPPSSPPLTPEDQEMRSDASSPLSIAADEEDEEPQGEIEKDVKEEIKEAVVLASRPRIPILEAPPIPDNVDLPALLASTVVFSGSSKLSLPDLVKHMLEVGSVPLHGRLSANDSRLNRV